ncbi:hypothetical protein KC330_g3969 [Hortaea werneckii]|nr:hypothetical protein KC330_g3969 [Hortaea werneckii]
MVSHTLITFCCICGAGVAVFIGWAVSHRFVQPPEAKEPAAGDFNQAQYMREVRLRHQDQLAAVMGGASALVGFGSGSEAGLSSLDVIADKVFAF